MILRKSLTARFIVAVFAVLLAGQILGTVLFVLNARSSLLGSLEERIRRTSANAAVVCFPSLQSGDFTQIDAYLQEVVRDDEIAAVHLLDASGKVVREKVKADNSAEPVGKLLSIKTPCYLQGKKQEKLQSITMRKR